MIEFTMRDAFLLDPDLVFLNHGSFGACPIEVFDAYQRWQRELERNPVEFLGRRSAGLLRRSREQLAAFVGAAAGDLVFVANATTGVNAVAQSLDLKPGDEVLGTDQEYGACDATWRAACARAGAHYRRVEIPLPFDADTFVPRLLAAVTPRTRLVFASHITSTTALIFPVAALCEALRERGIATLIDGAHAPGQVEVDLRAIGADYYTGNAHKWLCAPKGAAFLHVRPERQAALEAPIVSWGYVAAEAREPTPLDGFTGTQALERRLQWQGTRDIAAFLTVAEAIDFRARHDWPAHQRRCHEWALDAQRRAVMRNGLAPIAREHDFAQMVAIPVRCEQPDRLRQWLFERHRVEVPVTQHGERRFVRVSVQAYNTEADLAALDRALIDAAV